MTAEKSGLTESERTVFRSVLQLMGWINKKVSEDKYPRGDYWRIKNERTGEVISIELADKLLIWLEGMQEKFPNGHPVFDEHRGFEGFFDGKKLIQPPKG